MQLGAVTGPKVLKLASCRPIARPFTAFRTSGPVVRRVIVRVAEVEEVEEAPSTPEVDFEFNYNQSKKDNEYSQSDVEAALRFYNDSDGDLIYNSNFVSNPYVEAIEDAAFFDDVDNNQDDNNMDEYAQNGIPEAQPKTKRGGRRGAAGAADDDADGDDEESEKELKRAELAMELANAREEFAEDEDEELDLSGPWDWSAGVDTQLQQRDASEGPDAATAEIMASLVKVDLQELDEESQELVPLITDDLDLALEDDDVDDGEDVVLDEDDTVLSTDDEYRIDALLAQEEDLEVSVPGALLDDDESLNAPVATAEDPDLDEAEVQAYVAALRELQAPEAGADAEAAFAAMAAAGGPKEEPKQVSLEDVQDELEIVDEPETPLAAELLSIEDDFKLDEFEDVDDEDDEDISGILADVAALEGTEVAMWEELEVMDDEELDVLEQYVDATGDYMEQHMPNIANETIPETDDAEDDAVLDPAADDLAWEDNAGDLSAFTEGDDEAAALDSQLQERIIELRRVTKVLKGGKLMGFRCIAVVGDQKGNVGLGVDSGREVATATKRALVDAKRNLIKVPLVAAGTLPHRQETKFKSARVVIVPAAEGTGVIAGGAIRSVLELAGVQNCLAKRLGSRSNLNNARAVIKALTQMRKLSDVASARGLPLEYLFSQ